MPPLNAQNEKGIASWVPLTTPMAVCLLVLLYFPSSVLESVTLLDCIVRGMPFRNLSDVEISFPYFLIICHFSYMKCLTKVVSGILHEACFFF